MHGLTKQGNDPLRLISVACNHNVALLGIKCPAGMMRWPGVSGLVILQCWSRYCKAQCTLNCNTPHPSKGQGLQPVSDVLLKDNVV